MAELEGSKQNAAGASAPVRLAPAVGEGDGDDITTSVRYGPYVPGDYITMLSNKEFSFRTGDETVTADATSTPHPAGPADFTIPDGVTHVAMFSAVSGAKGTAWKS